MSFEETKARLVREFTETQAAIRAEFGMKTPAKKDDAAASNLSSGSDRRSGSLPSAS